MTALARVSIQDANDVKIVRFRETQLFDERAVREAIEQITSALPEDGSPIRMILDFTDVNLISSTLLSKLILLQRRVEGAKGQMRLCELSPIVQQVFRTSNLDRLFKIDRDQRTALDSLN
ncbi:MAG: anti-anti-sigma factor [Planctomycetes bacterium SCN 63-9]|nr:MAG: anti-anti-sigma factor [Planctomycetes bacterium SCN 63-9]